MPSINTEVEHQLGKEEATERLQGLLEQVRQQYGDFVTRLDSNWTDNVLTFSLVTYGFEITGNLAVEDQLVRLSSKLPLAAMAFRGKIEQSIVGELQRKLS